MDCRKAAGMLPPREGFRRKYLKVLINDDMSTRKSRTRNPNPCCLTHLEWNPLSPWSKFAYQTGCHNRNMQTTGVVNPTDPSDSPVKLIQLAAAQLGACPSS